MYLPVCLQVKTKGTRKITFEQCLTALAAISEKKVRNCSKNSWLQVCYVQLLCSTAAEPGTALASTKPSARQQHI
jgi:hypothetical protein